MLDESIRIQQAHVQLEQYFGSDFSAVSSEKSAGDDLEADQMLAGLSKHRKSVEKKAKHKKR